MMPQNLPAFRERKLRFDASKPVRFSRIRHCLIASLPQNRVRFSRPVKENQGLTIVAKAKKNPVRLQAFQEGKEGERGNDTAQSETWGIRHGVPPPFHEPEPACLAARSQSIRVDQQRPRSSSHPSQTPASKQVTP